MASLVFVAVLFAAACHAGWNALKEPLRAARIGAAVLIACGLVLIRLQ